MERDPSRNRNKGIHVCPQCDSTMVQPQRWEQTDTRANWRVWLRCPECEWSGDGIFNEREVDDYDQELDRGTHILAESLKEMDASSMREVIGNFTTALRADLITADDFRPRA